MVCVPKILEIELGPVAYTDKSTSFILWFQLQKEETWTPTISPNIYTTLEDTIINNNNNN